MRAVGDTVVGEHGRGLDALLAVPGHRTAEERDGILGALGGQQLGVGEAAVVVHRDVEILPAGVRATAHPVLADAFPHLPEPAELLDVDVQQLARPLAFIAHHGRTPQAGPA